MFLGMLMLQPKHLTDLRAWNKILMLNVEMVRWATWPGVKVESIVQLVLREEVFLPFLC